MSEIKIKLLEENKNRIIEEILRDLPEWFGIESAIINYIKESENLTTFTADYNSNRNVGFITIKLHNKNVAEIFVMGVRKNFHRMSIGAELLNHAKQFLIKQNFKFLTVKTLSSKKLNSNYEKTRKFYEKNGFIEVEENELWGKDNPCLFLLMVLNSAPN